MRSASGDELVELIAIDGSPSDLSQPSPCESKMRIQLEAGGALEAVASMAQTPPAAATPSGGLPHLLALAAHDQHT